MMESKTDGRSTGYFSPACGLKFLETTEGAGMSVMVLIECNGLGHLLVVMGRGIMSMDTTHRYNICSLLNILHNTFWVC